MAHHQSSCWLLLGCMTMLMTVMKPDSAAAARLTSTRSSPNLAGTIDIASESLWRQLANGAVYQPNRPLMHRGYDRDFTEKSRTVLKRSEKTMEEYKKYMELNCRNIGDVERLETFYNWEQHQFARHLKTNMRSQGGDSSEEGDEEKKRLRVLLTPDKTPLKSLCKKWTQRDYGEAKLLQDQKFEDFLVDFSFKAQFHVVDMTRIGNTGLVAVSYWPRPENKTKEEKNEEKEEG